MSQTNQPQGEHLAETCMCDACIRARVMKRIVEEESKRRGEPYLRRRGGDVGSVSVHEALKDRK